MRKIERSRIVNRDDWIVRACKGQRVLHIGCTDHPITAMKVANEQLLHAKLAKVATEVIGLDIDGDGIDRLRELMPDNRFIHYNAEELDSCAELAGEKFDLIVAADVIEHISNPGRFLSGVAGKLVPGGYLMLSTPHAFSLKRLLPMAAFAYEHVHPDHVAYYSVSTLDRLLERHNLRIEEFVMFQWVNPTFKNRFANALVSPFVWMTGGRLCDEIAVRCAARQS